MIIRSMNSAMVRISKSEIVRQYGADFYSVFERTVRAQLNAILPEIPEIGDSIFKSSYDIGIVYIAWFKSLLALGISAEEANRFIWSATENALKRLPAAFIPAAKKAYLGGMRKKAVPHMKKAKEGRLPEYDWSVNLVNIDQNTFRFDTCECAIQKLCRKFGTEAMLPSLCRMDYLTAHYLKYGFSRTTTLGDGDALCDHTFSFCGSCEWAPEKGFIGRK